MSAAISGHFQSMTFTYMDTELVFLKHLRTRVVVPLSFQKLLCEPAVEALVVLTLELRAAFPYAVHPPDKSLAKYS